MCQFHGESATFKLNPVNHGHQAGTKKTQNNTPTFLPQSIKFYKVRVHFLHTLCTQVEHFLSQMSDA